MTAVADDPITAAELYEFIGHHIRAYREAAGWTQRELANLLSRKVESVSSLETGRRGMSVADLMDIARVFQVPMTVFLPGGGR